jgi:hypothetical protein
MTLAARLQDYLGARAARETERQAARLARDTFILAQFPLLNARLAGLVSEAVGLHSRLAVTHVAMVETVVGRTFAALPKNAVRVAAALDGVPRTVIFTPRLEFGAPGQFGAVDCTLDFAYRPRRSRADDLARRLLEGALRMSGTASAHLMLHAGGDPVELAPGHIESALAALLLR